MVDDGRNEGGGGCPSVKPRVFYLNGLGGYPDLEPRKSGGRDEYQTVLYYIHQAVGEENTTHILVFEGYTIGISHLDMLGEALGIQDNWTEDALNTIVDELASNPLKEGQPLVIVGSSAGGTVAIELLDNLQAEGIFVDQVILRGSLVIENTLVNAGKVDYIAAENPYTDQWYSVDTNPFDTVSVQEHRVPGLYEHTPEGQGLLDEIGTMIYNLILGIP